MPAGRGERWSAAPRDSGGQSERGGGRKKLDVVEKKSPPTQPVRTPRCERGIGVFWHTRALRGLRGRGQVRQRNPRGPGTALPCPAQGHCEEKGFGLGLGIFFLFPIFRFYFRPGCFSHRLLPCGKAAGCGAGQPRSCRERRWGVGRRPGARGRRERGCSCRSFRQLGMEKHPGNSGCAGDRVPCPGALPAARLGDNQSLSVKAAHGPGGCSGRIPGSVFQRPWMR